MYYLNYTNYKELFMYYRAILVSIIASLADIATMFGLNNTSLDESYILIISSFTGLLIQFFGQKYWTFKNIAESTHILVKQIVLFFTLEITLILIIVYIFNKIYHRIENRISKYPKSYATGKISRYIFEFDNNNIELTALGKVLLKSVLVFFTFNLISYPLWRYVIFTNKK